MVRAASWRGFISFVVVCAILALAFIPLTIGEEPGSSWTKTTDYPSTIYDQSCVAYEATALCVGGLNAQYDGSYLSAVYYAPLSSGGTGAWASTTSYPNVVGQNSCVYYQGYVYCVGGVSGSPGNPSSTVYFAAAYPSGVGPWRRTTWYAGGYNTGGYYDPSSYNTGIQDQSCVAYSGRIYCVGGIGSSYYDGYYPKNAAGPTNDVCDAQINSTGVGQWACNANDWWLTDYQITNVGNSYYPFNGYNQSCVAYAGYIYCVGGFNNDLGAPTDEVYYAKLFANGTGAWSPTTVYPSPVGSESCSVNDGYIYCVGGSGPNNKVYYARLSPSGVGAWASASAYPADVTAQSCVTYSDHIYCVGGFGLYCPPSPVCNIEGYSSMKYVFYDSISPPLGIFTSVATGTYAVIRAASSSSTSLASSSISTSSNPSNSVSTSTSSNGGGSVPAFLYESSALVALIAVVAASYLLARKRVSAPRERSHLLQGGSAES